MVGYENTYRVSDHGRVRSLPRNATSGGILKLLPEHDGRFYVRLSKHGKVKRWRVARLVTEAFLGPRPDGLQVCHKNDVNTDDRLKNLYYGTWESNCADKVKNGSCRGSRNGGAKLVEAQVAVIKQRLQAGENDHALAAEYGVALKTLRHIKYGENWGWLE